MDKQNFNQSLQHYASLLIKNGINIQQGQTLVIRASIDMAVFVRILAKKAYELGAKNVHVEYSDEELSLIKYLNAPMEAFSECLQWKADGMEQMAQEGAAFLSLSGTDPDLLKEVDPEKIAEFNKANGKAYAAYRRRLMNSENSWCVGAVPTPAWARKVFPDLPEPKAIEQLWDYIFRMNRVYEEDPNQSWENHTSNLSQRIAYLNRLNLKSLHFLSEKTDLIVGLPQGHIWAGGGEYNSKNIYFIANMPTEEIFTAPAKYQVNGKVSSTMPLNYSGNLIEDFTLTFKDGKIIDIQAKKGYETLCKLIDTDKGSAYLGEVALVPYDSPISNTKTIYYNTLFDENASCHLAIGAAYPSNVQGGEQLSDTQLENIGINTSITHVDFMIGSKDMNIIGQKQSGEPVDIFKSGNWAF